MLNERARAKKLHKRNKIAQTLLSVCQVYIITTTISENDLIAKCSLSVSQKGKWSNAACRSATAQEAQRVEITGSIKLHKLYYMYAKLPLHLHYFWKWSDCKMKSFCQSKRKMDTCSRQVCQRPGGTEGWNNRINRLTALPKNRCTMEDHYDNGFLVHPDPHSGK